MIKDKTGIFIFILLLVFIISISIHFHMNDFERHYINNDQEQSIDLNSLYDENSLLFEEKKIIINDVDCSYIQLDGLKKAKVENNINKSIKNNLTDLINDGSFNFKNLYVKVSGNFGNTLSVIFYTLNEDKQIIVDTLNYNLVNGSELDLDDLFMTNVIIEDIVKHQIDINTDKDLDSNYLLQLFNDSKYNFYFDQFSIYLNLDSFTVDIPYYKYADSISLHTKYLTNVSIYKNNNLAKKDILIASYRDNGIYSILDYTSENVYTDLAVYNSEENVTDDILTGIKDVINNEIESISKCEKNQFIYLNQSGTLEQLPKLDLSKDGSTELESIQYSIYKLTITSDIYIIEQEYFKNDLKTDVYNLHRQEKSVNNFINFTKYQSKDHTFNSLVLLANGNILENLEDLFADGYDYTAVIKQYIIDKYDLSDLTVDSLLEDCEYSYLLNDSSNNHSYSIVMTSKNQKKFYIPFSIFDKKTINIY